ncbi:Endonuclease V protein [Halorhabdus tiamatea SARL4B]|uniref:Endonuclease V n=1 Tax=Halorhabdus tiamatea SARL4B TaxID=1033806 RepID=F7PFJ4_9EURY|nr:endonuclease V [Halorhabdus tiamatea]ERJ06415.1 Endonuclease V protein [Halorhabdus tiamatea SARL4B]CCQ34346.1 endonuclease V [Halorhabdus tiamatea SARL4B]
MEPVCPEFVPDPSLSREEMESLQREIADVAVFEDAFAFDPAAIEFDSPVDLGDDDQHRLTGDGPIVAGVDQAFLDDGDRALSAVVALQDGRIVDRAYAVLDTEIPYIPGLLSFREGGAILAALSNLTVEPDLLVVDGSGRIHFREAGLATHIGVVVDVPAIGVAKNLLCGTPAEPIPDRMEAGARIPIEADDSVETTESGTVIGHAVQTRQYDSGSTSINPLYVSPGHRVSAETTADIVAQCAGGYKLPEPTRLADRAADRQKRAGSPD